MTTDLPQRRTDLTVETTPEEARLFDPETGEIHVLNASAYAIWELCDGRTEPGLMADAVAEVTQMDWAEAKQQVQATIELLREKGLVIRPGPSSNSA
jgi:PqqD family protein of HPr-rel-A system